MVVAAWILFGVLSVLGVDDAGNVAAYTVVGAVVLYGIYGAWMDEAEK